MKVVIYIQLLLALLGVITCTFGSGIAHPVKSIMKQHMDSSPAEAFRIWHYLHERKYHIDSEEGLKRFHIFKKHFETVKSHNQKGDNSYSIGLNNFADMTVEEFKERFLSGNERLYREIKGSSSDGKKKINFWDLPDEEDEAYFDLFLGHSESKSSKLLYKNYKSNNTNKEFKSIDWIEKAQLKEKVENQGDCGSCWAFASAQAVQAAYSIKTGKSVIFSKQQLVDCESESHGCNGGTLHTAMDYIKKQGIEAESEYPYLSFDGEKCKYKNEKAVTKISSYEYCDDDTKCTDETLYETLSKGPVASVVDASDEFMLYEDGIFDKPCNEANHAILLVGYHQKQSESEESYWVVKNSWGNIWGDHGYIKIKHSKNYNNCLLHTYYVRPDI